MLNNKIVADALNAWLAALRAAEALRAIIEACGELHQLALAARAAVMNQPQFCSI